MKVFPISGSVLAFSLFALALSLTKCTKPENNNSFTKDDWPEYHGRADRNHYSALTQISPQNVSQLEKVWEYSSGGADTANNRTQIQCNPIIIDGILYGVSAGSQAFAIDAADGTELWKTSFTDDTYAMTSRGVTYYEDGKDGIIFFGYGHLLYSLNAKTGQLTTSFGDNGKLDLKEGLSRPGADDYVVYNTPGVIFENLLITGVRVAEGATALPGDIRAFDVNTGALAWTFKTIPEPGDFGSDTWPENARQNSGGANSWMGMAIDRENEIVYVPTGSAAFDFYGGDRPGSNLFANCLLALNAKTGERIWHYQMVHHDIWDRDLPAPPNLLTLHKDGQKIEAVAQVTKQGHVFVFNRLTGEPFFPIEERAFPASDMPGEQTSPTQPIPTKPPPFTRQSFTANDLNPTVADREEVLKLLSESRTGSPYLPITRQRTVIFPGTPGGAHWGGAAVDQQGILYVPASEIPVVTSLIDAPQAKTVTSGTQAYQLYCSSCHGADLKGDHSGTFPSLVNISDRMTEEELQQLLKKGRGMMPAFAHISEEERDGIISFLLGKEDANFEVADSAVLQAVSPYIHSGYDRWYDSNGFPVNAPPWGTLTAINLQSGELLWQVPLGEYAALTEKGIAPTGTDNHGGPLVTATGLIFIAATPDKKLRAYDKQNGTILWEMELPAAGYASPSTYAVNNKQYVVIACGGGKMRSKSGDKYVAFAIKE